MLAAIAVRSMAAEVAKRRSEAERLFACRPARIQFGAGRRRMWRFAARCRHLRFVAFSWVGSDRSKRFRPNNVGSCHLPMGPDTNLVQCCSSSSSVGASKSCDRSFGFFRVAIAQLRFALSIQL